eukprot:COSAG04_NODE_1437_length_6768_cov_13.040936_3_plen_259_part_00
MLTAQVREFLDEINGAAPAPAASPADAAAASPKTPPRARSASPAEPTSPFGPWRQAPEHDEHDESSPANALPDSPFDDPGRDSFPPWYSTPPAKQTRQEPETEAPGEPQPQPPQQPRKKSAEPPADSGAPSPLSPPFEVQASPSSLLKTPAGRVPVDGATPSTKKKKKKKKGKLSSKRGASAKPAATELQSTPGVRTPTTMPPAPTKKTSLSRTVATSPGRGEGEELVRPHTARHVSGPSVIYTKLSTPVSLWLLACA